MMLSRLQLQKTGTEGSAGGFVGRHDHRNAVQNSPSRSASGHCLDEKLAHRALRELASRAAAAPMSARARDRLYDRMFPSHICQGTNGDDDPNTIT